MTAHKRNTIRLVCLVFFLSGCSALIFETVWFRVASLVLGSSIWSATAVLSAFMSGLAIGNAYMASRGHHVKTPYRFYIIVELAIGISGVAAIYSLPFLSPFIVGLLSLVSEQYTLLNISRFCIAFIILLIPAVAMGTTLPLLQKLIYEHEDSFSSSIGKLYGWNTIGAVLGVIIAEFFLIEHLGIHITALVACLFNFLAALLIINTFQDDDLKIPGPPPELTNRPAFQAKKYLLPPFMTGLILLALEIIWFRYLLLSHGTTSSTFSIMLAVILCGIGLGGLIAAQLKFKEDTLLKLQILLPILAGFVTLVSFYLSGLVFNHFPRETAASDLYFILVALLLMLPSSIISGILFPVYGEMLYLQNKGITLSSGTLTLVNTIGAALGSGVASFLLLPMLGIEKSIALLSAAYLITALVFYVNSTKVHTIKLARNAGMILVLFIATLAITAGTLDRTYQTISNSMPSSWKLVKMHEGLNETLGYFQTDSFGKPVAFRLITNSHSMSGTLTQNKRYMKLYVYMPYLIQRNVKSVLQISYGVGNTAEAVTRLDTVEHFDVVDLSPDILQLSNIIHDTTHLYPLRDPRTHVHIEDGRFFLQTTQRRYDLITAEPPPPKNMGVVNLYSEEYFSLIHSKLSESGVVTYWLPAHSLQAIDSLAIIRAFCNVFSDCSLWNGSSLDFMLVGSKSGIRPVSDDELNSGWHSVIAQDLADIGFETPQQLAATFMADHKTLTAITKDIKPVTDNFPKRITESTDKMSDYSDVYAYLLNIDRRKNDFINSEYVQGIFSKKIIGETIPYFHIDGLLTTLWNPVYMNVSVGTLDYYDELVNSLQRPNEKFASMMLMGTNPVEQAIIENAPADIRSTKDFEFALIKHHLIQKQFSSAASVAWNFQDLNKGTYDENLCAYQLYLIAKALDKQAKKADLSLLPPNDAFIMWYKKRFL